MRKTRIGRNDICPCGSGKKYKKCCLSKESKSIQDEIKLLHERLMAKQEQITEQQGLGRKIISTIFKDKRFVAVGKKLFHNDKNKWQTFYDFLFGYLKITLGVEWVNNELRKTFEDMHPIVQWGYLGTRHLRNVKGEIFIKLTGALSAHIYLAYSLYLLEHNAEIQDILIKRLKSKDLFKGALYETYVAATLILAGFSLEIEDESNGECSHCEFFATLQNSDNKYAIEAKAREANKNNVSIGNQLYKALKKNASDNKRIVFIEMNIPNLEEKIPQIVTELKRLEASLKINGQPAPSAYLFITNHSYVYSLENTEFERVGFTYGFKIPDFYNIYDTATLREALDSREKHKDIEHLIQCSKRFSQIPGTFDGEIPFFALNPEHNEQRLLIGNKYIVPDKDGKKVVGTLIDAVVMEGNKEVFGIYKLEDGRNIIAKCPISDEELLAYEQFPKTFFGVPLAKNNKAENALDLYDFFYESYKNSPRENILKLLKISPDNEKYKKLSKDELLKKLCEGFTYSAFSKTNK